ncbi:transglutaminase domain-containing protein [Clostridium sp. C2-6-12]|uniref:transglutaminase domain-containing protein n=1 Tax=Clostridium sp. C2-6-12 TaxID=2698832 RepID=UPI00136835CB|nr:transglutaminase domain-containing protein [Clostridium sp. C2-6-12]
MKGKSEIADELYVIVKEVLITFSIQYGIFKSLNWEIPISLLFLISLIVVATIALANHYHIKKLIVALPIVILLSVIVLKIVYEINAFTFIKDAFFWIYSYSNGFDEFYYSYFIIISCILSIVIMRIILHLEKKLITRFLFAIVLVVLITICGIYYVDMSVLVIGIILFYCFDTVVEMIQVKNGKAKKYSERCLVPFIAGTVLLAICIPSDEQPIKWAWIRETASNLKEIAYVMRETEEEKGNEFNVNNVGLSEKKTNFLGNLNDTRGKKMLSVSTGYSFRTGYLNWIVRNKYVGDGWEKDNVEKSSDKDEYKIDLYEKLYNLYRSDLKTFPDEYFAKRIKYEICYDKILTKSVFRPENCYYIDNLNANDVDTLGDNIYFDKKVKNGYRYYVSSLLINMENDNMKQYLRNVKENQNYYEENDNEKTIIEGSAFQEAVKELGISEDNVNYITSDSFRIRLNEKYNKIRGEYLQVPSEVPDRVINLAKEITENCSNEYDKAEAIYEYLKNNYEYDISLDELPKGKDAVDYFLFEKKRGYCTYFASSMAIMCRSIGIPVRYVEGAVVDYKERENDWFFIKTGNSHAWTEIYLNGFGWIRMDPTPGNFEVRENWAREDVKADIKINNTNNKQLIKTPDFQIQKKSEDKVEISILESITNNETFKLWLKYIFGGISLLILLCALGIGLFILNQKIIYKKSDNRQKVLILMKKIIQNLEKRGYKLRDGETLQEFIERLEGAENFLDSELIKLLIWFQTIRYSKKNITEEEVFFVEQFVIKK